MSTTVSVGRKHWAACLCGYSGPKHIVFRLAVIDLLAHASAMGHMPLEVSHSTGQCWVCAL